MIRVISFFETEVEAMLEGERLKEALYGYGYTYKVYFVQPSGQWALDSFRYTSCD